MTLYLIAIGGSGSRCVESVIHLASTGLMGNEKIKVLFVDPDKSNGNYIRTCTQLNTYNKCRQLVWKAGEPCQWMRTEIVNLGISTVGAGNNSLSGFFEYNAMYDSDPVLTDLFDVLYTEDEKKLNLSEGFRGRPAIGSAFMSQLNFNSLRQDNYQGDYADYLKPWANLLEEIDNSIENNDIKILLCGSVFGGTGAAGLPVIARLLHDFFQGQNNTRSRETPRNKLTLGSILILPYFNFRVSSTNTPKDEVYARAPEFALNTQAAMRYYKSQMQDVCDVFYCVGDQNRAEFDFNVGGEKQTNRAHIVELYAGLAVRDFIYQGKPDSTHKIVFAERRFENRISWLDLPSEPEQINYAPIDHYYNYPDEPIVRHALRNAVRFAFVWYNSIVSQLEGYCKGNRKQGRGWLNTARIWLDPFFNVDGKARYLPEITNPAAETSEALVISQWCNNLAEWLVDLHDSDDNEFINLFSMDKVTSTDEINFGRLVGDDQRSEAEKNADTIDLIKLKLDPNEKEGIDLSLIEARGYVGLAKFVYVVCGL
jgi:hypothetical protein